MRTRGSPPITLGMRSPNAMNLARWSLRLLSSLLARDIELETLEAWSLKGYGVFCLCTILTFQYLQEVETPGSAHPVVRLIGPVKFLPELFVGGCTDANRNVITVYRAQASPIMSRFFFTVTSREKDKANTIQWSLNWDELPDPARSKLAVIH